MSEAQTPGQDKSGGALAQNILHFARALRAAGLPIGTGAALDAINAIDVAGVRNRDDFRVTLEAVFVKKREHAAVFDEAFRIFWRRRGFLEQLMTLMSPVDQPANGPGAPVEKPAAAAARVAQALMGKREPEREESAVTYDQSLTVSQAELLQRKDFAQMSASEIADALRAIAALDMSGDERRTRRFAPSRSGARIDLRRTLRRSMRGGGSFIDLARIAPQVRKPPIVILCDISGSMAEYTRVFLHFFHALTERRGRVHTFLFGTRLTNVTRALRHKDPDEALAQCSGDVLDWSGGTRIGQCLRVFNRDWSRRVLGQGATVLIFTDGLEREGASELAREMERLHKSARRLVWLNPLLRFDRFEPRAQGVRAMLPHVDEFRAVHNLASVAALAAALSTPRAGGAVDPRTWLKRVG
ncbi:MAG: VWA domain-containing protein [Beijerinckiaceae bacterium]|nr:VWA domain-containing protein [Beijerinckiaceae bacterium]